MKFLLAPLLISLLLACEPRQAEVAAEDRIGIPDQDPEMNPANHPYDSLLAKQLQADDYGMRSYVMALLKAGPNRSQDSSEAAHIQAAHLKNIHRMAEEGFLVLAGPFLDDGEIRGIYVFAVEDMAEAEALTASDPAVQAGRLLMELHPWYGSAGVMKINDIHERIAKIPF